MSQDALELLLTGVKDQGQRKQITTAYYAFANGDPETFAVQFAVLLRAHATSLKFLPARLEKTLAAETRRMSDLVIAHQNAIGRMAFLIDEVGRKNGLGEGADAYSKIQRAIENQFAAHSELLRTESHKITSSVAASERLAKRLAAHRIVHGLAFSYVGGILTVLAFHHLAPLLLSFFTSMGLRL
jgi:hypothetical protein